MCTDSTCDPASWKARASSRSQLVPAVVIRMVLTPDDDADVDCLMPEIMPDSVHLAKLKTEAVIKDLSGCKGERQGGADNRR